MSKNRGSNSRRVLRWQARGLRGRTRYDSVVTGNRPIRQGHGGDHKLPDPSLTGRLTTVLINGLKQFVVKAKADLLHAINDSIDIGSRTTKRPESLFSQLTSFSYPPR